MCDGLGSRTRGGEGAQLACLAVRDAARQLVGRDVPSDAMVKGISDAWRARLPAGAPYDFNTTCLFALARDDGRVTCGALGDGLVTVHGGEELRWDWSGDPTGFSNITEGLADAGSRWSVFDTCGGSAEVLVLLATDGVSDDLDPNHTASFAPWLAERYGDLEPRRRWRELRSALHGWPVQRHDDDKTIALLHVRPPKERE